MRRPLAPFIALALFAAPLGARADDAAITARATTAGAHVDASAGAEPNASSGAVDADAPPPAAPRAPGVVVESSIGAMGFAGQFRRVAPPGLWLSTQVGYELFSWLLVYGYGELTMTDTSLAAGPTRARAFPIYGFGAGARLTVHATPRVALFAQGGVGLLKADVPVNSLQNLGYMNAERLRPSFGARLGVEWYQVSPHFALGLTGGMRMATGFARVGRSDTPAAWEGAATLRYTF